MKQRRPASSLLPALLLALAPHAQAGDAVLDGYLHEALQRNPSLLARGAGVAASLAQIDEARAQQLPQLSFNARYTRADGGRTIDIPTGDLLNPVYDTLNRMLAEQGQPPQFPQIGNQSIPLLRPREQETKLSISAPLLAPALWAQVDARIAQSDARRAAHEAYARTLVRELKRAYYGAAQAQAQVQILEASEALLAENVRVSQALIDGGKATRERRLRADAELLAMQQQLDSARARAAQARRLLNLLRGSEVDAALELPSPEQLPLDDAQAAATRTRPELRQLEDSQRAAAAAERAARAESWPTLGVAADYGIQGTDYRGDADADFGTVSLVLRWTLWDSGNRRARRAAAAAQSAELAADHEDLQRRLTLAQRAAVEDLATARRAVASSSAQLAAADEAFRIAERKRAAARLSQIEFLAAERARREARLSVAIARCAVLDRAAELEYTTAGYALPEALRASP